jgi:adenylate cyclase class 2
MLEVEVKARVRDVEALKKRLTQLGARYLGEEKQVDVYFNHPSRDFASRDEALRLRRAKGSCYLAYKGPKLDGVTKTRVEHEVKVACYEEARRILESLGFTAVLEVNKTRRLYALGEYIIALDSVEGLGNFVEVEKKGSAYEPKELLGFLKRLGVAEEQAERRSYLELLLEKHR